MSYEAFKEAQRQLGDVGCKPPETVESLQRHVLSVSRLDAVRQIQDAMIAIAQMETAINQLATLHALPVRRLFLPQVGMLAHQIDGLLFEHGLCATRLAKGGVPLATQVAGQALPEGFAA